MQANKGKRSFAVKSVQGFLNVQVGFWQECNSTPFTFMHYFIRLIKEGKKKIITEWDYV